MQKIKYINNRDLLAEIHKSKTTYCHFISPEYAQYDAIVGSIDQLTPEFLAATLHSKQVKLAKTANGLDVPTLTSQDVVFRVMADNHLPEEADERSRRRSSTGGWVSKTNFPPFQHYMFTDGILVEVGRSHWKDDLETGSFCTTHGKMTHRLASMFLLLVQQYSSRGNWRGYCVSEDHEALTQRGWLNMDQITEDDIILSYNDGKLTWSKIKSIYRDETYEGLMFAVIGEAIDALVTPGHSFITQDGLKPVELLTDSDRLILDEHTAVAVATLDISILDYKGRVWCPETEYGSFMARRNGRVYLVGNSYVSDMRGQALVQLSQVGLQFDESRSDNPFAWYTQIIKNAFRRILLLEKRNHEIRDDLLIMSGAMPSYTRQVEDEMEQRENISHGSHSEGTAIRAEQPKRRGRRPKTRVSIDDI